MVNGSMWPTARVDEIRGKQTGEIETALHVGALDATRAIEAAQRGRRAMAAMPSYQRAANTLQAGYAALGLPLACERRSST
jgi:hypothetical protein